MNYQVITGPRAEANSDGDGPAEMLVGFNGYG